MTEEPNAHGKYSYGRKCVGLSGDVHHFVVVGNGRVPEYAIKTEYVITRRK